MILKATNTENGEVKEFSSIEELYTYLNSMVSSVFYHQVEIIDGDFKIECNPLRLKAL